MELGEKLKQARLEAGLSQRQLCGDTITRNMLSQIENGTANPSIATLQVLANRLGKPITYFREDVPSQNLDLLYRAANAKPQEALEILQDYLAPDPVLDKGYHLLYAKCCMDLSEIALAEGRTGYAKTLFQEACAHTRESRRLAILADAFSETLPLPDNTDEMLLRAKLALRNGDAKKCLACLMAADRFTDTMRLLQGDALMLQKEYSAAIECFLSLKDTPYSRLEICYRELGDFQKAYEYACKQR